MVKQFILLLQLIGVFIYQLVLTGDVTVTQVVPSSIQSNTNNLVEIHVSKGKVAGFAKVQQEIPAGFAIEPVETKGATFSYKDNRVKFIWMALPAEEEFTISYNIKPIEGTTGEFTLSGKFSYIDESERKNISMTDAKFTITEEVLAETPTETTETSTETTETTEEITETTTENTSEETTTEVIAENTETSEVIETTETEVVAEDNTNQPVEITSNRSITDNGDGSYSVKLAINKKGIEGFAKVTEKIPAGFIAEEVNPNGGVFTFKENQAKVLWMAIPKGEEMVVEYLLKSKNATNGNYSISGAFAYLENDITQEHSINSSNFDFKAQEVVAENIQEIENTEEVVAETIETSNTNEETETNLQNKVDEKVVENTNTEKITSVPSPETGVSYKVQVGAGHQTIPSNWFAMKFNLTEDISTETHEGWIKYVVGSYAEYKAARDKRNTVRNKVKRAFVTAYNSGKRITVQEALMISNQKWYK